jgi:hypothetical protein
MTGPLPNHRNQVLTRGDAAHGRFTSADDLNEPLPAELKIAYCWCRLAFIGRIPDEDARIATVNAHQTGECLSTGGDRCVRSGISFFLQQ